MADNPPTPASPEDLPSNNQGRASQTGDSDFDATSDIIEESPLQHINRLIDEHERDFKQKLRALTSLAKILAGDHAKSVKQLKRACNDYAATSREDIQFKPDAKPQQQPPEESHEVALQPEVPTLQKPQTTAVTPRPSTSEKAQIDESVSQHLHQPF